MVGIQSQYAVRSNMTGIDQLASESMGQCYHICSSSDTTVTVLSVVTSFIDQRNTALTSQHREASTLIIVLAVHKGLTQEKSEEGKKKKRPSGRITNETVGQSQTVASPPAPTTKWTDSYFHNRLR